MTDDYHMRPYRDAINDIHARLEELEYREGILDRDQDSDRDSESGYTPPEGDGLFGVMHQPVELDGKPPEPVTATIDGWMCKRIGHTSGVEVYRDTRGMYHLTTPAIRQADTDSAIVDESDLRTLADEISKDKAGRGNVP